MSSFGKRLQHVRGKLSRERFAARVNSSVSSLRGYENDRREPRASFVSRVAREFGINEEWLLTGKGEMHAASRHPMERETAPETVEDMQGLVSIPYYSSRASAGAGAAVGRERIVRRLVIAQEWLQQWGIRPLSAQLLAATGDSMIPTIQDGDVVLFETSGDQFRDGIYLIGRADDLLLKRVQRRADGSVALISDNRLYQEEILPAHEAAGIRVVGRVRMIFKKV